MTDFNPFSPEFKADPYATYAALREEPPALQPGLNFWPVSRYDDVTQVLKNPQIFSSAGMGGGIDGLGSRTIISTDPPDHTYLRNLVNRAFTPRMVAEMEPRIREIARDYVGRVAANGRMDLVADLAIPLPVTIIAEILGVEAERREDFKRWSNALIGTTSGDPAANAANEADIAEFRAYFTDAVAKRQQTPHDDLIAALVQGDAAEGRLTSAEIVAFAMLLLIAGNETTTNLIGNALKALCEHPDQLALVTEDAARIPNMIEEALRWDSPVQFLFRMTKEDTVIGDAKIPAGNPVIPIYASANHDESKYPGGERFDITGNTQGHLAFGLGPHFCLGAPLARLEAKVAFEELFAATRNIRTDGEGQRIDSLMLRGMKTLPIAFEHTTTTSAR
jgi:cytochrome P450